ncbi:uncharacterized protein BP5553_05716 [Venustampulla echinocandica]|uniref:Chitin-binding type-4 domain-containing protein n=1 Tax=Venustampulla echinocandica TaxID=2656787 RepID=A0A370TLG5_9HELO|nr:uncharacterized protein BP5553_05716 [Venustampulla echinocandica]RDL36364.1 hypothetical protein BP5553_05716 [Venustampulla echinocandica]
MLYSSAAALLGFAALGSSHMIMNTPIPFGKSSLNNSPLLADGSDFPCKQRGGVYEPEGASNPMPIGSTQPLKFTGSATHGGGSCQISVTYDAKPNKNSVWKVIHSIQGGCPAQGVEGNTGNDANAASPSTYSFKVPSALPVGEAVLAWTWFNKVGNREMYMNCAPITISGGSAKRSARLVQRDQAAFNALPDMFTANIGPGCATENGDLKFPNPGASLETLGAPGVKYFDPVGATCQKAGSAPVAGSSPSADAEATKSTAKATAKATAAPSPPGGVFATVEVGSKPTGTGEASKPTATGEASKPTATGEAPKPTATGSAPTPTGSAPNTGSGSAGASAPGTKCATEGMWNCIGGTSFQQCASGTWSVVQQLAAGTTCAVGQSAAIDINASKGSNAKRAVNFSA